MHRSVDGADGNLFSRCCKSSTQLRETGLCPSCERFEAGLFELLHAFDFETDTDIVWIRINTNNRTKLLLFIYFYSYRKL